jgi:hypothetical protein
MELIEALVNGEWAPDKFLVVPPGERRDGPLWRGWHHRFEKVNP